MTTTPKKTKNKRQDWGCPVCGSPTCNCGESCRCTEEQHCSNASSLLQSLAKPGGVPPTAAAAATPMSKSRGRSGSNSSSSTPTSTSLSTTKPSSSSCGMRTQKEGTDPLAAPASFSRHNADDDVEQGQPDRGGLTEATTATTRDGDVNASLCHKAGFFEIEGMKCTNCSSTIQTALLNMEGIKNVNVNIGHGKNNNDGGGGSNATVEWMEPPQSMRRVVDTIESVGFHVKTANENMVLDKEKLIFPPESSASSSSKKEEEARMSPLIQKVTLEITGMTCSMCSQAITRAVESLEGVESVHVSLSTDSAMVKFSNDRVSVDAIQEAIEDVGYDVDNVHVDRPPEQSSALQTNIYGEQQQQPPTETVEERWQRLADRQEKKVKERRRAFLWSLAGAAPILVLTMILPHIVQWGFLEKEIQLGHRTYLLDGIILWLIATPVQFISGWDFYRMTFYNLRANRAGMDVLVALGTSASYGYACWALWKNDHKSTHFFETSATLICFVLAGKWMQALAVRRTSKALTELMKLQSPTATKVTPGSRTTDPDKFNPLVDHYREETLPIEEIYEGDLLKVIRGSSIPSDGRIKYGEMSVDESMVTGESMPVLKTPGSDVLGGTVCVETGEEGSGAVFVEVTGVGADTALAQIIELVQDAQTRSVPIQSFADSVSAVFVPTVCVVSLLTFMTWYALCSSGTVPAHWYEDLDEGPGTFSLTFGIACLVISCPCALGLATPTAVMVGSGTGARLGVLMKGGEALEVASKVDSVVLDKTGTLTKGQPSIADFHLLDYDWVDKESLLWMLGSLEKNSEHPLAQAVVTYAQEKLGKTYLDEHPFVQPKSFKALTGRGATGIINDTTVAVGNRPFASESGIEVSDEVEFYMQALEREGKTAVVVSVNGTICLVMGIADELKDDAAASVLFLRDVMKVDVWMVTGDNQTTARAIGEQLGLPENRIISEALPVAKVQQVRRLQAQDRIVAMVGDGINDSPALAQADVGISLGSGAKIATEASDMVLVRGNVADVCTALHLSHSIFRRIQLNLLFSLLYNCLGIPIAAGLFYPLVQARLPPTLAGAAMALSSVSVVLSSLSLRFYRPPQVMMRRQSSFAAWAREMERRGRGRGERDRGSGSDIYELEEPLLGRSEFTESTMAVDNRTSRDLGQDVV